jgi:hypothetical protein
MSARPQTPAMVLEDRGDPGVATGATAVKTKLLLPDHIKTSCKTWSSWKAAGSSPLFDHAGLAPGYETFSLGLPKPQKEDAEAVSEKLAAAAPAVSGRIMITDDLSPSQLANAGNDGGLHPRKDAFKESISGLEKVDEKDADDLGGSSGADGAPDEGGGAPAAGGVASPRRR